jgi:putative protein-disulfide isomerase
MSDAAETTETIDVVYGNDPLCGWCFATGPQISEAKRMLGARASWRVMCGGLVVGARIRPIGLDRDYLVAGLRQVEHVSGRAAGEGYRTAVLEPGTWVSDSEPACRAVLVVQDLYGDRAVDFSHALTDALYLDGRTPERPDTIRDVADTLGLDGERIVETWARAAATSMMGERFAEARAAGVTTYPSVFVDVRGRLVEVAAGYVTADELTTRIMAAATTSRRRAP